MAQKVVRNESPDRPGRGPARTRRRPSRPVQPEAQATKGDLNSEPELRVLDSSQAQLITMMTAAGPAPTAARGGGGGRTKESMN